MGDQSNISGKPYLAAAVTVVDVLAALDCCKEFAIALAASRVCLSCDLISGKDGQQAQ